MVFFGVAWVISLALSLFQRGGIMPRGWLLFGAIVGAVASAVFMGLTLYAVAGELRLWAVRRAIASRTVGGIAYRGVPHEENEVND